MTTSTPPMHQSLGSSFRDPSGFVYKQDGILYRQINVRFGEHYEHLLASGLYESLVERGLLVFHAEVNPAAPGAYRTIRPELIEYVSYPYEWCFSQLKDAALLTLEVQQISLHHGMSLKDASAYNVQFQGRKPIFIDTLSFERYEEGSPWVAYGQFCRHFLGPLALMSRSDVRLRHLLRAYIDGVPLDLTSSLLPLSSRASYGLLAHLHMHARSQKAHQADALHGDRPKPPRMSRRLLTGLVESLHRTISKLTLHTLQSEWGDYYDGTNYSTDSMLDGHDLIGNVSPTWFLFWLPVAIGLGFGWRRLPLGL